MASRSARASYDVVFPSKYYLPIMIRQGMLEQIDKTLLSNLGNIDPEVLRVSTNDHSMDFSVPYFYGAAGIIVNTARVPDFERSWSIFNRTDLRGRMAMLDDMREVMGGALVYLGHSVNTTNPAIITDVRDFINTNWRPNLVKFDSEAFGKGYANGDFWVVHGFPEVVFEEIEGNDRLLADTVFFIPQEGGPSYIDYMVILKGSRNIELAHKFIDFIHRTDIYAEIVDSLGLPATVNIPARSYKTGNSWYSAEDLFITELVDDLGDDLEYYNNAWFNSIRVGE